MTPVLSLPVRLDSNAAPGLRDVLLRHRGCALQIRADATTFLGALCAQVLVSAARTWAQDRRPLTLGASSAAFDDGLAVLGLKRDDITAPGQWGTEKEPRPMAAGEAAP